jgi:hypothetical protein
MSAPRAGCIALSHRTLRKVNRQLMPAIATRLTHECSIFEFVGFFATSSADLDGSVFGATHYVRQQTADSIPTVAINCGLKTRFSHVDCKHSQRYVAPVEQRSADRTTTYFVC